MTKRIAINGFGRIGRLTFRNLLQDKTVEVVAINDLTDNHTLAHLLKYDTAHGPLDAAISADDESITVDGHQITALSERDPSKLPWAEMGVDVVIEATGIFRTKEKAQMHIDAGAKKVVISAPGQGEGISTAVIGVNEDSLTADTCIISNASCTTNCLAPIVKVIDEKWGIQQGAITTTHAYTADQRIQDAPHSDLRRARAAAQNMVPTSTGAAKAVGKVYPPVDGKLMALAIRVPVITGSLIELNVLVEKEVTREDVLTRFKMAADGALKGVIQFCEDPIVSSDIIGNKHSSIFDSLLTQVSGQLVKVVAWYDNEAGYSARLAQLVASV